LFIFCYLVRVFVDQWRRKSKVFAAFRQQRPAPQASPVVVTSRNVDAGTKAQLQGLQDQNHSLTLGWDDAKKELNLAREKIKKLEAQEKELNKLVAEAKTHGTVDKARSNLDRRQLEREKAELAEKLKEAGKPAPAQPAPAANQPAKEYASSAVGSSMDLALAEIVHASAAPQAAAPSAPVQNVAPLRSSQILADVSPATRRLFLAASAGTKDSDLLEGAERRVLYRKNPQSIASAVVRTLAEEIQRKLQHDEGGAQR
jgi:hypothetical protein